MRAALIVIALAAGSPPATIPHGSVPPAWRLEAESSSARVTVRHGTIDIDTPAGLTLWATRPIHAPVTISFEAMAVAAGGPNDAVSDLNAFWMATDANGGSVLATPRSGQFADYDDLKTYYVGVGGNRDTTTRMRRYVGKRGDRPLLPQHDRSDAGALLVPNRWTRISLIADGHHIAVRRDGRPLFTLDDPHPYRDGHWALRTTASHLRIRDVVVTHP